MNMKKIYSFGVGLSLLGAAGFANAAGTEAGTQVYNKAVVAYELGGATQVPIESSPNGNSTAGENNGEFSAFTVDRKLDLNVLADASPVQTLSGFDSLGPAGATHPANLDVLVGAHALKYTVTNLSNSTQDIRIQALDNISGTRDNDDGANQRLDAFATTAFRYFLDDNDDGLLDELDTELVITGNGTWLDAQAPDTPLTVFVVASIESGAVAESFGHVTLAAQIHELDTAANAGVANPNTLLGDVAVATTNDPENHSDADTRNYVNGIPDPASEVSKADATVDTILIDGQAVDAVTGNGVTATTVAVKDGGAAELIVSQGGVQATDAASDGQHADTATYQIASSAITVAKSSKVYSDPFNGLDAPGNPAIRIPGAEVTYTISVVNAGSLDAEQVNISDEIPANTTYIDNTVTINGDPALIGAVTTTGAPVTSILVNGGTVSANNQEPNSDANGLIATQPDVLIITFRVLIN